MSCILIVEDDPLFTAALRQDLQERENEVRSVSSLGELDALLDFVPDFAIVDLKLRAENGIDAVERIQGRFPSCRSLVLTGYGSIASAVQAVKAGAVNYIPKPASTDDILEAFNGSASEESQRQRQSLARHEREYIEKVLQDCGGNVSRAAVALGIHRQSLQRKLRKFTP